MVDYANTTGVTNRAAVGQTVDTYAEAAMLTGVQPQINLSRFALTKPMPKNKGSAVVFSRFKPLAPVNGQPLVEGVTPTPKKMEYERVPVTLAQYGDLVLVTDQVDDLCYDPVMQNAYQACADQAAETMELVTWGAIIGGTNVYFANGASRAAVSAVLTTSLQRKVVRSLKSQRAVKVQRMESSDTNYGTQAIAAAYMAVAHTDLEADIRAMDNFVASENYGTATPLPNEIGKVEDVRYITSPLLDPFIGAGSTTVAGVVNDGTNVNVYPVIYFGKDAFGNVPLKGRGAIEPSVVPVGQKDKNDPLGQRGYVGWKAYMASLILNQSWLVRAEVAVSDLG